MSERDAIEKAALAWWVSPISSLVIASLMMISWVAAKYNPAKNPPSFLFAATLAVSGGAFISYVLPWITRLFPPEITFYHSCLRFRRGQSRFYFSEMDSFSWRQQGRNTILTIKHQNGRIQLDLGVPPDMSTQVISAFLMEKGVKQASDEKAD